MIAEKELYPFPFHSDLQENSSIFSVFMKLSPSFESLRRYTTISAMTIGVWQKRWDHAWHCCAIFQWQKSPTYLYQSAVFCLPAAGTYKVFKKVVSAPVNIRLLAFVSSLSERIMHFSYLSLGKSFRLKSKGCHRMKYLGLWIPIRRKNTELTCFDVL